MKAPSFQFYPADWRKDPAVQSLSYHDRGIWFEIICLMHESEQRGKLLLNGKSIPDEALSRLLGLDNQILTKTLTTLLDFGVAAICPETGALMNKRMVRDEEIRKVRKECGFLGGNPQLKKDLVNQKSTTLLNQKSTPSSSSSSSSSELNAKTNKRPQNLNEVQSAGFKAGVSKEDCEAFWHHFESTGWIDKNGHEVQNWQSKLMSWNNFKINQKNYPKSSMQSARIEEKIEIKEFVL